MISKLSTILILILILLCSCESITTSSLEKQSLISDINSQITNINVSNNNAINNFNTLENFNESISDYTYTSFNEFKKEADSLNDEFNNLIEDENTYSLIYA